MHPDDAATKSGVHPDTLERWCARGYDAQTLIDEGYELPEDDVRLAYHRFLLEYLDARDDLYEILIGGIRDDAVAGNMDTRERLAVLERLRSDRFGRRDHVTVAGLEPGAGVPMTERYADTLADLLRGIIADLGLTPEQAQHVPIVIERNLERVSARERMRV